MVASGMRIILIKPLQKKIDVELLRQQGVRVAVNALPEPEGLAIFDCGRPIDWKWGSEGVYRWGECDVQRNKVIDIPEADDATGLLLDLFKTADEASADTAEEEAGFN